MTRVQSEKERLRVDKDNANFEIAALFPSLYRRVKKGGNFKIFTFFVYHESFLYWLNSSDFPEPIEKILLMQPHARWQD